MSGFQFFPPGKIPKKSEGRWIHVSHLWLSIISGRHYIDRFFFKMGPEKGDMKKRTKVRYLPQYTCYVQHMSFTHSFHPTVSHGFFESRFFLKSQSVSRRSVHLESFFTHRPKPGNSLAPRCFTILKRHWELRAGCLPIRRFGWYPPWNNIYIYDIAPAKWMVGRWLFDCFLSGILSWQVLW